MLRRRGGEDALVPDIDDQPTADERAVSAFDSLRSLGSNSDPSGPADVPAQSAPIVPASDFRLQNADIAAPVEPPAIDPPADAIADVPVSVDPAERLHADEVAPEVPDVELLPEALVAIDRTDGAPPPTASPVDDGTDLPSTPAPDPSPVAAVAEGPAQRPVREVPPLPRIIAVANQKGGVGKTTTTVNLGAALAERGYRVLVIDLDPQGNATTGLGVQARNLQSSVYDVLMRDTPLEDAIEATAMRNLFVVGATIDLAGAEIELVPAFSRELKLKRALAGVGDDFDFTLIDCPPSLGLLTVNALAAAGEVLVPIQCEYYALEGLGQLLKNVQLVRGNLNPTLEVTTIILTMFDARTKLSEQVANEVREHFGPKVCRAVVPRTVRLSEAPSFGQPIIIFDPISRGSIAYRELAKEVAGGAPQRIG